jgi:parvulin-like peptidyl-prolyl isomerase
MKKLFLIGCITLITLAQAKMVDAIAMVVEGEAVTTAEIRAVQRQNGISKAQAVDMLIINRLQKVAMKEIVVSEDEVDSKITAIAAQNHVSIPKMQKILKQQGTSWVAYRTNIREATKREKFFKEKVISSIPTPSEDELKLFYKKHKKEFIIPSTLRMVEYSSKNEEKLKQFLQTKKAKGIHTKTITKKTKTLSPTLLTTLLQTKNGAYTQPFNSGEKYIMYKMKSKSGRSTMPFELAQPIVITKWKQQQQGKALKDYFEKLRVNADIQKLR